MYTLAIYIISIFTYTHMYSDLAYVSLYFRFQKLMQLGFELNQIIFIITYFQLKMAENDFTLPCLLKRVFRSVARVVDDSPLTHKLRPLTA